MKRNQRDSKGKALNWYQTRFAKPLKLRMWVKNQTRQAEEAMLIYEYNTVRSAPAITELEEASKTVRLLAIKAKIHECNAQCANELIAMMKEGTP